MKIQLIVACVFFQVLGVQAQEVAPMTKESCLACHGSFDALMKKNVQAKSDDGQIVNPHVYIPHQADESKSTTECVECHSPHAIPPKPGYKDKMAGLEPCYACHHNYQFKKCSSCHSK